MGGYELTDRGKVIIAVLLVIIVLIIPSVIISINALVRETPEDPPGIAETTPQPAEDPPGEVVQRPVPDGDGLHPSEDPNNENLNNEDSGETNENDHLNNENSEDDYFVGEIMEEGNGAPNPSNPSDASDSSDSSDASAQDSPEQGLVGLNVAAGTMAFIYFPGTQNALDTETASAIGEFLASPRNTENARVVVQFPRLAEGDRLNIVNAILHELTERGVARQDIVFFTIDADADENSFEVNLSFQVPQTGGK